MSKFCEFHWIPTAKCYLRLRLLLLNVPRRLSVKWLDILCTTANLDHIKRQRTR